MDAADLEIDLGLQNPVGPQHRHEISAVGATQANRDRLEALARAGPCSNRVDRGPV
jgi:hypothetical protein